jgi:hypothetical protein
MKKFKSICAILALALSLSIPVYADGELNPGDGHTPGCATEADPGQIAPQTPGSTLTTTIITNNGVTVVNVILALFGLS